jgi:hypothetical protein
VEPSLTASHDGSTVLLAYRGRDNVVRYRYRSPGSFQAEQVMQVGGQPLAMSPTASPAVAFTRLPLGDVAVGRENVVAAVIDTMKVVQLYTPAMFGRGWTRIGIPYGWMGSATGRPAMAWVGRLPSNSPTVAVADPARLASAVSVSPGSRTEAGTRADRVATLETAAAFSAEPATFDRFYILYIRDEPPVPGADDPDPVKMQFSYVDESGRLRIGHDTWFDNVWNYAYGIDVLQSSDLSLRAVQTYAIPKPEAQFTVRVRPHADGVINLPYRNYDDWKVIAWGSCATLRSVQTPAMQVNCPAQTW